MKGIVADKARFFTEFRKMETQYLDLYTRALELKAEIPDIFVLLDPCFASSRGVVDLEDVYTSMHKILAPLIKPKDTRVAPPSSAGPAPFVSESGTHPQTKPPTPGQKVMDGKPESSKIASVIKVERQSKRKAHDMEEDYESDDEGPDEEDQHPENRRRTGHRSQDVEMQAPEKKDPISHGLNAKPCEACERRGVECHRWTSTPNNSCLRCRRAKLQCSLYERKATSRQSSRRGKNVVVFNLSNDRRRGMSSF